MPYSCSVSRLLAILGLASLVGCSQQSDLADYVNNTYRKPLEELQITSIETSHDGDSVRIVMRHASTCVVDLHPGTAQVFKLSKLAEAAGCKEDSPVVLNNWLDVYGGGKLMTALQAAGAYLKMTQSPKGDWVVVYSGPARGGHQVVDTAVEQVLALNKFQERNKPQRAADIVNDLTK